MQLNQLQALVGAAECGTLTGAARVLGLSQPAITRSLKQLERDVGATLLIRSASGIGLTPYGEALLPHARQIVAEARRGEEQIRQMVGDRSGRLAIASSAVPMALILPGAVEIMRRQFPRVYLQLQEAVYPTVLRLFADSSIDFAIGPTPAEGLGEGFRCVPLFEVELVVVVNSRHPKARARSLKDLQDQSWIITGPSAGPGAIQAQVFIEAGLEPPTCAMSCASVSTALQIVQRTDVVSFVPYPLAYEAEAAGHVNIIPVKEKWPPYLISLFMPSDRILTPAGQAMYSAMRTMSTNIKRR